MSTKDSLPTTIPCHQGEKNNASSQPVPIPFTSYTIVRLRSTQQADKKVLFVTHHPEHGYKEYVIPMDLIPTFEKGEIIVQAANNGTLYNVTIGTMQPSFTMFLSRYRLKHTKHDDPAPQVFLSLDRLKNGWPVSYDDGLLGRLRATQAEMVKINGWTNEPIADQDLRTFKRTQFDTERKGQSQFIFEEKFKEALSCFTKMKTTNCSAQELKMAREKHISQLIEAMPMVDKILCEHKSWTEQGFISVPDIKLFLDHGPNVMHFSTYFA